MTYREIMKDFVLDERSVVVKEGDFVLFLEDGELCERKVWGVRCVDGNYEVKICGANGGWKRKFYKLAED